MPDSVVQLEADEPAEQHIVLDLRDQLALAADDVEHLEQRGTDEALRRFPWPSDINSTLYLALGSDAGNSNKLPMRIGGFSLVHSSYNCAPAWTTARVADRRDHDDQRERQTAGMYNEAGHK